MLHQASHTFCRPNIWGGSEYSFSFNGMEKVDDIKGDGNALDFGARIYDSRLGRWMSVDPRFKDFAGWTPYKVLLNSPIVMVDPNGEVERDAKTGKPILHSDCKLSKQMYDSENPAEISGYSGYVVANDGKTKLSVMRVKSVHLTNLDGPDPHKSYSRNVSISDPMGAPYQSNCYGDALFNRDLLVTASSHKEIANFLIADGYRDLGQSNDFHVGDIIMFDEFHMALAVGKNKTGDIIWRSAQAGSTNEDIKIQSGTLNQMKSYFKENLEINLDKFSLFRPTEGDKYFEISADKKSKEFKRQDKNKKVE